MAALTQDKIRDFAPGIPKYASSLELAAAVKTFVGSALSIDAAGNVRPLNIADLANGGFAGFTEQQIDNLLGSAGDQNVLIRAKGIVSIELSGVTIANIGDTVYMTSDNDFTLTAGSNIPIGKITQVDVADQPRVAFEATALQSV